MILMAWLMEKKKTNLIIQIQPVPKSFGRRIQKKDLLNIKCISNTIKYKKLKIIPNSMVRRMFNPI